MTSAPLPDPFSADRLSARRAAIDAALEGSALVLASAPWLKKSRDTDLRYRPASELAYVTGVRDPGAVAVLRGHGDDAPRLVLFVPERDPATELWTGPVLGVDGAARLSGVDEARPLDELDTALPDLLLGGQYVYARTGEHPVVDRAVQAALGRARFKGTRDGSGPRGVLDPGLILDDLRLIKDDAEIATLRRACALTVHAFQHQAPRLSAGQGEWQVEAAFDGAFRAAGAWGPAYPTIVGSGPNACVLHHTRNDRVLREGELVLIDAGAEVDLYAADVTRTFPVDGRFTPEQRAVYEIVAEAQRAAVAAVAPGATLDDVHDVAVRRMVEGLIDLGVLSGGTDEILEEDLHTPYVPHRTSHWLGLDVHDVGDYARAPGEPRVLEPGMVFSVEPGLYLPAADESVPEALRGLGVRIEDDILVTDGGHENLTADLPVATDDVEAWLG